MLETTVDHTFKMVIARFDLLSMPPNTRPIPQDALEPEFSIHYQYYRSFVRSPKPSMFIAIYLRAVPGYNMLEIPREKVCMNPLDDYFVPNIYFSLLKDEYQPRLRCDTLKSCILSIFRQLTLRFRFYLTPSRKYLIVYVSD
jgi:hypothetical protein